MQTCTYKQACAHLHTLTWVCTVSLFVSCGPTATSVRTQPHTALSHASDESETNIYTGNTCINALYTAVHKHTHSKRVNPNIHVLQTSYSQTHTQTRMRAHIHTHSAARTHTEKKYCSNPYTMCFLAKTNPNPFLLRLQMLKLSYSEHK